MLFPKIFINKIFLSSLWFRYIFLSFSYLFFYIINPLLDNNINIFLFNINKNTFNFGFKIIFSLRWLFNIKNFNFLNRGKFLLIFSNDYGNFIENKNLILYSISFSSYFININYFSKLYFINLFYKYNFYFLIKYNIYYLINIFKYIYLLFKISFMHFFILRDLLIYINKCLLIIKNKK